MSAPAPTAANKKFDNCSSGTGAVEILNVVGKLGFAFGALGDGVDKGDCGWG
jgi:hypothetical protein